MESQIIGIKQLYTEMKHIAAAALAGKSFTVVRNSKPVFRIEPVTMGKKKKYTLADLRKIQFSGGEPDLSMRVDEIAYHQP